MTVPPCALLALPEDAVRLLLLLLDGHDHQNIAAISRAAARDSYFQKSRDARACTLSLPATGGDGAEDVARARRLLHGIYARNPQRLAFLQSVLVVTAWQAALLLKDAAIAARVESVRVESLDARDTATVSESCDKLCGLPNLRRLDVSCTPLVSIDVLSQMTQLRSLNLSATSVTDLSALVVLTELRELVLKDTLVLTLDCIRTMQNLEVLRVSKATNRKSPSRTLAVPVFFSSLEMCTHLHTLELHQCSVKSTGDLLHVAHSLRHVQLTEVHSRNVNAVGMNEWPLRDIHEDELIKRLVQLETIHLGPSQNVPLPTASTLAKIPSLRVIKQFVDFDLHALETLVNLEEISFFLPEGDDSNFMTRDDEDYCVLLRLPKLRKVTIKQTTRLPRHWLPDVEEDHDALVRNHATTLTGVLMQLPHLTCLDYKGLIPNDSFLPAMKHLTHLALRQCDLRMSSFEWLRAFDALRSLELVVSFNSWDLSVIGELTQLESLRLQDTYKYASHLPHHYAFLARLVNLNSLHLVDVVEDLEYLRGMTQLETLNVRSASSTCNVDALSALVSLRVVDVAHTNVRDLTPLASLPHLREAAIPADTDCRPLVDATNGPPRLLRVLHPDCNCIPQCHHRSVMLRRELESHNAADDSDERNCADVFVTED